MSRLNNVHRISTLLILIIPGVISLSVNSQNATLTNAVSSNSECEEEILLICGMRSLDATFRFTDVIWLPINTSEFATEPSFIGISVRGYSPHAYGWPFDYASVSASIRLNTTFVSVSQGKLKADILVVKFEKLLNMSLLYDGNSTWRDSTTYSYAPMNASSAIQKLKDVFLEHRPYQGFDKIVTPTLLDNKVYISFELERETGNLTWETEVDVYCPNYFTGGLYEEQTFSLRELANYEGTIDASPYSTKSLLRIIFDFTSMWPFGYVPMEKVRPFETIPSQMEISGGGEVFEKDITGGSVEDLYMRFKYVRTPSADAAVWFFVVVLTALILGPLGFIMWTNRADIKRGFGYMRKRERFSVSLIREYGIQLGAVLFTCFVIYQFRNPIISLFLDGLESIGSILNWFDVGGPLYLTGIISLLVAILIVVLVTAGPGFFVGLLTGGEGKGMISVGIGSFLAPWVGFVYWAPGVLSLGADVLGFVLGVELILLGTIILSLVLYGVGMLFGTLGEGIGIDVRREVLIKRKEPKAWEFEDESKELKEQLGKGVISQDEYEQLHFALSNLASGIITKEEYEQKKKKLLEKSET